MVSVAFYSDVLGFRTVVSLPGAAFLQAEELGAPLTETLGGIARDSRRDAAQRARQRAARTVPKVTLLVSTVMVPPTIIIIGVGMYLGADVDLGTLLGE